MENKKEELKNILSIYRTRYVASLWKIHPMYLTSMANGNIPRVSKKISSLIDEFKKSHILNKIN